MINAVLSSDVTGYLKKSNMQFLVKGELSLNIKTGKFEYINAFINREILHKLISNVTVMNEAGVREIGVQLIDGNSFVLRI